MYMHNIGRQRIERQPLHAKMYFVLL
jgi:hypothetical protein